jgi:hypothetical protein
VCARFICFRIGISSRIFCSQKCTWERFLNWLSGYQLVRSTPVSGVSYLQVSLKDSNHSHAIPVLLMSMGRDDVSELQLPTGLLFTPRWYTISMESHGGMILTGNRRTRRDTCPIATLSTTNPTFTDPARTRASAVRGWQLTAWTMAQPLRYP